MNRQILIVLGLACAGATALAAGWWPSTPDRDDSLRGGVEGVTTGSFSSDGKSVDARLAALEEAFAIERNARQVLEDEIFVLHESLARLDDSPVASGPATIPAPTSADSSTETQTRRARRRGRMDGEERRERLIEVGFSSGEAQRILQRESELQMESIQARYEAQRSGDSSGYRDRGNLLRDELGDDAYARYLDAYGRPSSIALTNVYENSPAMTAGLRPGDEIVRYDGQRVFNMNEISAVSLEGIAGENVVIDVLRDGTPMQFSIPRGPLGVAGGRRRR